MDVLSVSEEKKNYFYRENKILPKKWQQIFTQSSKTKYDWIPAP